MSPDTTASGRPGQRHGSLAQQVHVAAGRKHRCVVSVCVPAWVAGPVTCVQDPRWVGDQSLLSPEAGPSAIAVYGHENAELRVHSRVGAHDMWAVSFAASW